LIAQEKTDPTTPKLLKDVLWSMDEAKAEEKNSYVDEGEEVLSHRNSDTTPN
jgi:hypothetical protein